MSSQGPHSGLNLRRQALVSLAAGVIGLAACLTGALLAPAAFFPAYLAGYRFFLGIGLGCLVLLLIYHLTGGAWGFLLRRILEAGTRTIPLLALLFIPLLLGLRQLFPWARPDLVESTHLLQHQRPYMNLPFFIVRAVIYFSIWIGSAIVVNLWSRRHSETGDAALSRRLATFSAAALVAFGVTLHFASIDWLMSLQPVFHSTMIGPLVGSGQVLSAQALALLVLALLLYRTPLAQYASADVFYDLGNLLLTFVIVWAYMVYFEYMLGWIANLRHEAAWFLPRTRGGWGFVALVLIVFHLAIPFFLLLMRDVKRRPRILAGVCVLILAAHLVFGFWQVLPAFPDPGPWHWLDAAAVIGIGGVWLACFLWELRRFPLVADHDASRITALILRQESEEEFEGATEVAHA